MITITFKVLFWVCTAYLGVLVALVVVGTLLARRSREAWQEAAFAQGYMHGLLDGAGEWPLPLAEGETVTPLSPAKDDAADRAVFARNEEAAELRRAQLADERRRDRAAWEARMRAQVAKDDAQRRASSPQNQNPQNQEGL